MGGSREKTPQLREFHWRCHHPIRWQWTKAYCNYQESSAALSISLVLIQANRWTNTSSEPPETPSLWEDFASISPLFCSHHVFLVFHFFFFLGFVCRSMPMLEKLSMPLAVRLAGITNCHVFVHALRTIKWKISYLQYNSHVITHIH